MELTPKLLGLILYREIEKFIHIDEDMITYKSVKYSNDQHINIDTLTRLMKEWLIKQGYMINVYHHHDTVAVSMTNDAGSTRYSSPSMTEFEAVLKATEWVAKEKGLL